MWQGILHYRCRETEFPENNDWKAIKDDHKICGQHHTCEKACGSLFELQLQSSNGSMVDYSIDTSRISLYRDSMLPEFNYGITNFDNLGSAYLTIFQCTTLEGWSDIMNMIKDSSN